MSRRAGRRDEHEALLLAGEGERWLLALARADEIVLLRKVRAEYRRPVFRLPAAPPEQPRARATPTKRPPRKRAPSSGRCRPVECVEDPSVWFPSAAVATDALRVREWRLWAALHDGRTCRGLHWRYSPRRALAT